MGVDLNLYLPTDVRAEKVADFMAIKLGAKSKWGGYGATKWVDVPGAKVKAFENISEFAHLQYDDNIQKLSLTPPFRPSFHWGSRFRHKPGKIYNLVSMHSSPQRIAVARAAAKFFGGILVPNDYDDAEFQEYKRTAPVDDEGLLPEDGEPWDRYQNALSDTKPLTFEEIAAEVLIASYRDEEEEILLKMKKKDIKSVPKGHIYREAKGDKGPGRGWWKQPVRHSEAAKKGHRKR